MRKYEASPARTQILTLKFVKSEIPAPRSSSTSPSPSHGRTLFRIPATPHTQSGTDAVSASHPAPLPIAIHRPAAVAPSFHAYSGQAFPSDLPPRAANVPATYPPGSDGNCSMSRGFLFQRAQRLLVYIPFLQNREDRLHPKPRPCELTKDARGLLLILRLL